MDVAVDSFVPSPRTKVARDDCYASNLSLQHETLVPQLKAPTSYCGDDVERDCIQPPSAINVEMEPEDLQKFDPPIIRRLQAFCSLYIHHLLVVVLIAFLLIGCALWQGVGIWMNVEAYHTFGPGVVAAKAFAGALYPSIAILLASSSRRLQTFCRNNTFVRHSPIWDLGHVIHMWMACLVVIFGSLHGVSHLAGTFRHGSQMLRREPSPKILHGQVWSYKQFLGSLPGTTGIALLVMFWAVLVTSLPSVRRHHFEIFRWVHFLVHPLVAILCVHGCTSLLQRPQVGYWIALPTILVLYEKARRITERASPVQATISVTDDIVTVVCFEPPGKRWHIKPGQYVMLLMPPVDKIQWHPFTVSSCGEGFIEVHIKCTIGWTERLRRLGYEQGMLRVYVSGPFGAPAQRYTDYRRAIMIGCGIGITPVSAILQSMTMNAVKQPLELDLSSDGAQIERKNTTLAPKLLTEQDPTKTDNDRITSKLGHEGSQSLPLSGTHQLALGEVVNSNFPHATPETQEIDVHLIIRDQRNLAAFTRLFNTLDTSRDLVLAGNLSINLGTYLTGTKQKPDHSPSSQAQKPRAGSLYRHIHYGRPNVEHLLRKHYLELVAQKIDGMDVAVFVGLLSQGIRNKS